MLRKKKKIVKLIEAKSRMIELTEIEGLGNTELLFNRYINFHLHKMSNF